MTPTAIALSKWHLYFAAHPTPEPHRRKDGGCLLTDGVRIVRVSPPPASWSHSQMVEVTVIDGPRERVVERTGARCAR